MYEDHHQEASQDVQRICAPLEPETELGLAMLIAEDEDGHYEPVAVAASINEAKELAEGRLGTQMRWRRQPRGFWYLSGFGTNSGLAESTATTAWRTRSRPCKRRTFPPPASVAGGVHVPDRLHNRVQPHMHVFLS